MADLDLNHQAREILDIAEKYGVEQNFLFITTFKRYQVQTMILNDLEKTLRDGNAFAANEDVNGHQKLYVHPAIAEYNKTAAAANKTVQMLIKIITTLRDGKGKPKELDNICGQQVMHIEGI
jgi:hypothetical protein